MEIEPARLEINRLRFYNSPNRNQILGLDIFYLRQFGFGEEDFDREELAAYMANECY